MQNIASWTSNFFVFLGVYNVTMERLTPPEETFLPNDTDHDHSDEIETFYGTFYVKVSIIATITFNIFPNNNGTQVTYCQSFSSDSKP